MGTPEAVEAVGVKPPASAFGKAPPIATSKMTKNPWCRALFQVVASTWLEYTVKKLTPSRYQRICSGETLLSYSIRYVWKAVWHPEHARCPLLMPLYSLHGPPGAVPQWSVPNSELSPLTSSMMSTSPIPQLEGQPAQL